MTDIQNYSFLIVFPDGTVYEGEKFDKPASHHEILTEMKNKYPYFDQITASYDLKVHKDQVKLYNQLVKDGAIIYHSWSTYTDGKTNDANIYLPKNITIEQKKLIDSIDEQLYAIENIIPYELYNKGFLEMPNYEILDNHGGLKYIYQYIDEHLIKHK